MRKAYASLICGMFFCSATLGAGQKQPNVVVMIADDLGSGDVSCLFREDVKTPNIDRLAASGVNHGGQKRPEKDDASNAD